jgi:hypothetical protein
MDKFFEHTLFTNEQVCTFHDDVIIDNIPCNITLKYYDDGKIRLILHHTRVLKKLGELLNDEDDEYLYNLIEEPILFQMGHHMTIENKSRYVMEQLNIAIQNIRFCRYTGKFVHKDIVDYVQVKTQIQTFFKNNTNIKFCVGWQQSATAQGADNDDKCCICYEPTLTTGCCTHPICIPCAIQIKPDEEDDILCPICRDILAFV